MNKLLGFYELRELGIPTVRWEKFTKNTNLDNNKLWTIRTAVLRGNDFNLPRMVGTIADEARLFGNTMIDLLKDDGLVICYPFFKAIKSGTLQVSIHHTIIEAVAEDLWNLVTEHKLDVSIEYIDNSRKIHGKTDFLSDIEEIELKAAEKRIREKKARELRDGSTFLLEWSFAQEVDVDNNPISEQYLVFYECRTI